MTADPNAEQAELRHELVHHSDRFLETAEEIEDVMRAPVEDQARAPAVARLADELSTIANAQEAIGDEIETSEVSIEDVAARHRSDGAPH